MDGALSDAVYKVGGGWGGYSPDDLLTGSILNLDSVNLFLVRTIFCAAFYSDCWPADHKPKKYLRPQLYLSTKAEYDISSSLLSTPSGSHSHDLTNFWLPDFPSYWKTNNMCARLLITFFVSPSPSYAPPLRFCLTQFNLHLSVYILLFILLNTPYKLIHSLLYPRLWIVPGWHPSLQSLSFQPLYLVCYFIP